MFIFRARTAEAAKWMLTKEKFGYQQSTKNLNDNFEFNGMDTFSSLYYIGSEDSVFPKSLSYTLKTKTSGLNRNMVICVFELVTIKFQVFYL